MPRKKRVVPPSLDGGDIFGDSGITLNYKIGEWELRDDSCIDGSRGWVHREQSLKNIDAMLKKIVEDDLYLNAKGLAKKPFGRDYMRTATRFAEKMIDCGLHPSGDKDSLRKEYYPRIIKHLHALDSAIKNKSQ